MTREKVNLIDDSIKSYYSPEDDDDNTTGDTGSSHEGIGVAQSKSKSFLVISLI